MYTPRMNAAPVNITLSLPAELAEPGVGERARVLLVLDAVRSERFSWRDGARMLGLAPSAFLDLAREHDVPVVRADDHMLDEDLATLRALAPGR